MRIVTAKKPFKPIERAISLIWGRLVTAHILSYKPAL